MVDSCDPLFLHGACFSKKVFSWGTIEFPDFLLDLGGRSVFPIFFLTLGVDRVFRDTLIIKLGVESRTVVGGLWDLLGFFTN